MKKLEEIPKKEIFRAPDNFFQALPDEIRLKIDGQPKPGWNRRPQLKVALASTLVVIISFIVIFSLHPQQQVIQDELSSISEEELFNYLETSDITFADITESLQVDDELLQELLDKNFPFNAEEFEEQILLDLEKYSDELL